MKSASYWSVAVLWVAMVGLLTLVSAPPGVVLAADDFKSAKKQFTKAKKEGSSTAMSRALRAIGSCNTTEAAKFLLKELQADQKARARGKLALPGKVRDKLMDVLAEFTDDPSVKIIGEAALKLDSMKKPTLALDQFDFFKALSSMEKSTAAAAIIRAALAESKNPYIKCAALEAVRQNEALQYRDDVIKILYEDNEAWAKKWKIVPINVFACLEALVDKDDKELAIKVVEATIHWEEKKWCDDERVRFFGGKMLWEATGEYADMASVAYWKWWLIQIKRGAVIPKDGPKKRRSRTVVVPPMFDAAPVGKRFVFVIDVSTSMNMDLKIDLKEIKKRSKKRRGPITRGPRRGGEKGEDGEKEPKNPLEQLDWKNIGTKMELARAELARAIESMVGDRYFAIVTYSGEVECPTNGWVAATRGNCNKWSGRAEELEAEGITNIHGGLMRALRISDAGDDERGKKQPAVDTDLILTGADTIIFLTDGWANWSDDSTSREIDDPRGGEGVIGDGTHILGPDIWPDIIRQNLFRKVIINTVGIGHHDKKLMKALARESGGTYVDWYFPES